MTEFKVEISMVNGRFLPLALKAKDFARRQEDLRSYLSEDLRQETSVRLASAKLNRYRRERDRLLGEAFEVAAATGTVPARHAKRFLEISAQVGEIQARVTGAAAHYERLIKTPPTVGQTAPAEVQLAAQQAFDALLATERVTSDRASRLSDYLTSLVTASAVNLEVNEIRLRRYTIILASVALAIGALLSVWAVVALRPLRRLQALAAQIAAGDYEQQISEGGPREVSDLARQFNLMARAVREREREVVRSERLAALGKMAQLITHEIRNPLSSIGLNTELLQEELSELTNNSEAKSLCTAIHREVDRLTTITETYLTLGRLPKPELRAVQPRDEVAALAEFVGGELQARHVRLEVVADAEPAWAMVDVAQLRQCLLNLVRNAAEAAAQRDDGCVSLRVQRVDANIEIVVADNGPGIAPEALGRIFEPFFSTKKSGSGLGLALTQQIVHDHQGTISAHNVEGGGAEFRVVLPACEAPASAAPGAS